MSFLNSGIFGLGGMDGFAPAVPPQLANIYDKKGMKKAQIKSLLTNAGLAMLAQGPSDRPINFLSSVGQGLQAGVKAADQTGQDYRDVAYQTFKINQDQEALARQQEQQAYERKRQGINDQWAQQEHAHQQQTWQEQQDQKKNWDNYVSTLPPDQQNMARMFPQIYSQQFLEKQFNTQAGGGYFGTPLPIKNPDGTFGYGLAGKDGTAVALPAPNGGAWMDPYAKSFAQASGKAAGDIQGDASGAIPGAQVATDEAKMRIDDILADPELSSVTGFKSYLPDAVSSNSMLRLRGKLRAMSGTVFLQARQALKGGGAITDFESKKAEQANSRIETAIQAGDVEELKSALVDLKTAFDVGMQKLRATAGQANPAQPNPILAPTQGGWQIEEVQ